MPTTPKFRSGEIYVTAGAAKALFEARQGTDEFLHRHMACDWVKWILKTALKTETARRDACP
jgi:hypothetical protein